MSTARQLRIHKDSLQNLTDPTIDVIHLGLSNLEANNHQHEIDVENPLTLYCLLCELVAQIYQQFQRAELEDYCICAHRTILQGMRFCLQKYILDCDT